MERRDFIKSVGLAVTGLAVNSYAGPLNNLWSKDLYTSNRPAIDKRNFVSDAVEATIKDVKANLKNQELAWLFENCFPNTLDTTVKHSVKDGKPDTFVITGDIDAMWLRDSTAQVWPYLSLTEKDEKLATLINGLVRRQTECIIIDPYANAFLDNGEGESWDSDHTDMKPELHERKWEIDSLCYTIRLAYGYVNQTGDTSCLDERWLEAQRLILRTFKEQQRKEGNGPYKFMRNTPYATDTTMGKGYGNPINPVGLIVSSFRPSDDATYFSFLVPSNHFAVISLRQMAELLTKHKNETELSEEALSLADEVEKALKNYAVFNHLNYGEIIPYEVDGFGNHIHMDDANVPSLLSLPYLGVMDKDDPLYKRTRKFLLSENNPWFFKGKYGEGIGGPHVGPEMVWPMAITVRALTSTDDEEILTCLKTLVKTHGGTGFMHETFHIDDPENFTREWFAWANTLFGELILNLYKTKPELLDKV